MNLRICFLPFAVLFVFVLGCGKSNSSAPQNIKLAPLSIAVVENEKLAGEIQREVRARTDFDVKVKSVSRKDLLSQPRLMDDVVFYPPSLKGELISRGWIGPIPSATEKTKGLGLDDVAYAIRQREIRWGSKLYAFPLGSPVLVLMVRKSVLDQLGMPVPQTWTEYERTVVAISESDAGKAFDSVTLEPLADEFLASLWLARCAAYIKHSGTLSTYFDFSSGEARIDMPGFVRGTEDLQRISKTIPENLRDLTPKQSAKRFLEGQSAMAIGWLSPSLKLDAPPAEDVVFAPIPGAIQQYNPSDNQWEDLPTNQIARVPLVSSSGLIGSISAYSGQTLSAGEVLALIAGEEVSPLVSPASDQTMACRRSAISQASGWVPKSVPNSLARQYLRTSLAELEQPRFIVDLCIPNSAEYRTALDHAIKAALSSPDENPKPLLEDANAKWNAITETIGNNLLIESFQRAEGVGD